MDTRGNPNVQTSATQLSSRHVPHNRPSTIEVCAASPRVVVSSRPSPHPGAVVMQIQSFLKEPIYASSVKHLAQITESRHVYQHLDPLHHLQLLLFWSCPSQSVEDSLNVCKTAIDHL